MTKTNYQKVEEFHATFGHPINMEPKIVDEKTKNLRIKLIEEELSELKEAINNDDIVEIADALGDILYVTYGAGLCYGVNLDDVVEEIHSSNMSKLDTNGKPIYREDGKVQKGPNYKKPDISRVINKG